MASPPDDSGPAVVDEVTGARPLGAEEIPAGIAAMPLPALEDGPISAEAAAPVGLASPLPDAPRFRPAPRDLEPPPARGELAGAPVPRLLVAVHEGEATGALTLSRGPVRKVLVFEAGVPVYAASNVGAERFAAICVRRGVLSQEQLDAVRRDAPPGARSADLLETAGLLTPSRRVELLAGQIRAIAWSTFEWREGSYSFQLGRPPASRVPLRLAMGDLILDGMRRASTLPRLRAELDPALHLAPAPEPPFQLYELTLRPAEARFLTVADGTKNVADLVRLADMPERDALAFLQACRVMGILDAVERVLASTRRIGFM